MGDRFSPQQLRQLAPLFQSHADQLCDVWDKQRLTRSDGIDVHEALTQVTLDIISTTALRHPLNTLLGENQVRSCAQDLALCKDTERSVKASCSRALSRGE